ncbi:MAG: hypothetical protein IKC51_08430, partial [Myxococcaceae bacterium]|nr:hypothetical protein [Myxococcaceae bacterium]
GEPVWGVFWEEFRGELNNCRAVKRENQQLPRAEAFLRLPRAETHCFASRLSGSAFFECAF